MLKKLSVTLLILTFAVLGFAKEDPSAISLMFPDYDLAPGAIPGISQASDAQWDLQYAWIDLETQSGGDNGLLGIAWDGTKVWVSGRGATGTFHKLYVIDPVTNLITNTIAAGTTGSWGLRDLCYDGTSIVGGYESGVRFFDAATMTFTSQIPFPAGMTFPRAIAYDPATDHFYSGNFASTCYEFTRQSTVVRQWAASPLAAIYGMAWDDDDPAGPWLWINDQTNPVSGCNIHQFDPATLTYTGFHITLDVPPSLSDMAGGCSYGTGYNPIYSSLFVFNQGTPDAGAAFEMYLMADPLAPGAPTGFTVSATGASLTANLAWTNPSVCVNGTPLTALTGVKVMRDGVLIADLTNMVIGAPAAYTDVVLAAGNYGWELIPYNTYGDGTRANASHYMGLDVASAPTGLAATPGAAGALNATLNWTAPATGAHGGYFTGCDSYNIYRALQGGTLAPIGTSTTATFFDNTVPNQGWYFYGVAGVNASGEGDLAQTTPIYIGPAEWEPTTYNWFEISTIGTPVPFTSDDQNLGPFPIGMAFPWYNSTFPTTVRMCTNGFASFTSTSTTWTGTTLPNSAAPNDLLSVYWDDMTFSSTGDAYYYYDAANTRFIMEWYRCPHLSYTSSVYTFQIILEDNGDIIYQYQTIDPAGMTPFPSATVGIENQTGTVGIQCTYNGSGPWEPTAQSAVIIYSVGTTTAYNVTMTLTPVGLPIVIPAIGGGFDFNIAGTNNEAFPINVGVWTTVTMPDLTTYGPIINVTNFPFAAGQTIDRDRVQAVPAFAPTGNYTYNGYMGIYPSMIWDQDSFPFSKSATDNGGSPVEGWYNWGEAFPGESVIAMNLPSSYTLSDAYPNPFNPTATIGYTLPQRSLVELTVFDVTGRQVTTLVKGWMDAGTHQATFYADGLASGVYFYRLTANDFTSVKKMILMK